MPDVREFDWSLYRRWVWANGWSELLGLGGTLLLGWEFSRFRDGQTSMAVVLGGALGLVLAGILLEGVLVGYAQWRVLRQRLPGLAARNWIVATAAGAGMAWLLGMIPSTAAHLSGASGSGGAPPLEGAVVFIAAAGLGLLTGPILGLPQWFVLRRHVARAGWWVAANAVAWAGGMVIIFAGAHVAPRDAPTVVIIAFVGSVCWVAGLLVGAVHGIVLIRLLGPVRVWH